MATIMVEPDPERRYANGALLGYRDRPEASLRAILSAIPKNYCVHFQLQRDTLLANLRNKPEFTQLLSAAKACQDDFLSKRARPTP